MRLKPPQRDRAPKAPTPTDAQPAPSASNVSFFSLGPDDFATIDLAAESPEGNRPISPLSTLPPLSAAESLVLAELVTGRSNRQIAETRGTSLRTVTNQVSAVFRKLGVRSRSELVLLLAGGQTARSEESEGTRGAMRGTRGAAGDAEGAASSRAKAKT